MGVILGINAKIYYTPLLNPSTGVAWNTPTPTNPFPTTSGTLPTDSANTDQEMLELDNVRDASLNLEKSEADITTRGGNGWRQKVGVLKDGGVTFQMIWDSSDPAFQNISHAFFNDKHIYLAIMDQDAEVATSGYRVQGLYAPFSVLSLTRNEALEEALVADVSISPTFVSGFPPQWVDRTNAP